MVSEEVLVVSAIVKLRDIKSAMNEGLLPMHFGEPRPRGAFSFLAVYAAENNGAVPTEDIFVRRTGYDQLVDLPANINVTALSREVIKLSKARQLEQALPDVDVIRKDPDRALIELIGKTRDISLAHAGAGGRPVDKALEAYLVALKDGVSPLGIPYPWPTLNEASLGMHPGEWIVFYARPGCQKTWLLVALAVYLIVRFPEITVLFYSAELPREIIERRVISLLLKQPYGVVRQKRLDFEAEESLKAFIDLANPTYGRLLGNLIIAEPQTSDVSDFERQVDAVRPHIVIADSLYKLSPDGTGEGCNDPKSMAKLSAIISRKLKTWKIPGVGAFQANRTKGDAIVSGGGDLAMSDALARDADDLYRSYPFVDDDDVPRLLIQVVKSREFALGGLIIEQPPSGSYEEREALRNTASVEQELQRLMNKGRKSRKVSKGPDMDSYGARGGKQDGGEDGEGVGEGGSEVRQPSIGPDPKLPRGR